MRATTRAVATAASRGEAFAAGGAHAGVFQRVEVHGGDWLGCGVMAARAQGFGDAFGVLQQAGTGIEQAGLAGEQRFEQQHKVGPALAGDGEGRAQVEQGALADAAARAEGLDEAERGVGAAVLAGAGAGLTEEHKTTMAERGAFRATWISHYQSYYGTTLRFLARTLLKTKELQVSDPPPNRPN